MTAPNKTGKLFLITGPSGVGKGTVVKELLTRRPEIWMSVSATTRLARPGELEGKDYFFLSAQDFDDMVISGGCLEWAVFAGNKYGTPRKPVEDHLQSGLIVLLEIELEGARQVRKSFPGGYQIFLAPPSLEELESRIRGRGTDSEDAIQRRLMRAREEMMAQNEFDAVLVNSDIEKTVCDLEGLMGFDSLVA